jgi:hypothetical protein
LVGLKHLGQLKTQTKPNFQQAHFKEMQQNQGFAPVHKISFGFYFLLFLVKKVGTP